MVQCACTCTTRALFLCEKEPTEKEPTFTVIAYLQ